MTKIDKNTTYFSPLCLCTEWKVHCLWKARACLLGLSMYFAVAGKEDGAFFSWLILDSAVSPSFQSKNSAELVQKIHLSEERTAALQL